MHSCTARFHTPQSWLVASTYGHDKVLFGTCLDRRLLLIPSRRDPTCSVLKYDINLVPNSNCKNICSILHRCSVIYNSPIINGCGSLSLRHFCLLPLGIGHDSELRSFSTLLRVLFLNLNSSSIFQDIKLISLLCLGHSVS